MGGVMSRQEKRAERELIIIDQAIRLFVSKGFLGVRMAEVAKASGFAMGTIYSHFAAKEDLLMACATLLCSQEKEIYQGIIASKALAMQRIVIGFTVNWLIAQHHPQLVEIQNLSLMPSVWSRANPQRIGQLNALQTEFSSLIQGLAMEMLNSDLGGHADLNSDQREELAILLNHGMWGLCVGLNSTAQSGMARADGEHHEACSYKHFTTNVIHFLQGYGWRESEPEKMFDACRVEAMAVLAGHRWFSCSETAMEPNA